MTATQRIVSTCLVGLVVALLVVGSAAGIRRSLTLGSTLPVVARALAFVIFGGLQVGAMWISLLPQFAHR